MKKQCDNETEITDFYCCGWFVLLCYVCEKLKYKQVHGELSENVLNLNSKYTL